jgi:hypothetical protein
VRDLAQALDQIQDGVSDQDIDLITHLDLYRIVINDGRKILVVGHSQGNLYANAAYNVLAGELDAIDDMFSIVAVATPDSHVGLPGRLEPYITLYEDTFASELFVLVNPSVLPPNTRNVDNGECGSQKECHSFVGSYLGGVESRFEIQYAVLSALIPQSEPITLTPSRDIWTTSVYSYAPSGGGPGGGLNDDLLRVGGWGDEYRSLLQFSLISAPTNAISATLRLYDISANSGTPVSMYLDRITSSWDWTTQLISPLSPDNERLWWVNRPSFIQISTSPLSAPTVGNYYDINITDLYNQWRSGAVSNYGVQLRPTSTHNEFNVFASSENATAAWRPQLIVVGSDE